MPSPTLTRAFTLAFLGLVAACGGSVATDVKDSAGSTGSSGGAGSTGGSSTTGGTAGGLAGTCPESLPNQGAACSDASLICQYGDCCPSMATCDGSKCSVSVPFCPALTCPQTPPNEGDPCDPCGDSGWCGFACPGASTTVVIGCEADGHWHMPVACPPPPEPCGMTTCKAGEVCLIKSGGAFSEPSCIDNPCGSAALDCSCAASTCGGAPFQCSVSGQTLQCTCPMCP